MKTICALATARFNCAIHIIRLSGYDAFNIINKIINKPIQPIGFKIFRRNIVDKNNNIIDDVLINCFVAPKSYTGENLIEINCHGGVYLADKIISLLISNGATHAKRGEFSQRALLNKKVDVSQVEAINNIVYANNDISIYGAVNALSGNVSKLLESFTKKLFLVLGQIEVNIDYPEFDDVPILTNSDVLKILQELKNEIDKLLIKSKKFIPINEGIKIALIGEPNVGKSTLLNTIIKEEKAIVTNIPGTTRDIVESTINIDGLTLKLFDTAGIRNDAEIIESIGVQKSKEIINKVDLILWLVDSTINNDSVEIKQILENKKYLKVLTKSDLLKTKIKLKNNEILISSKNNDIDQLINKIKEFFYTNEFELNSNLTVLQSNRQIDILEFVNNLINNCINELNNNITLDLIATDLEIAYKELNKLLGKENEYDFLDDLFKNFCIGK